MTRLLPFSEKRFVSYTDELCASFFLRNGTEEDVRQSLNTKITELYKVGKSIYPERTIDRTVLQLKSLSLNQPRYKAFSSVCFFASQERALQVFIDAPMEEKLVVDTSFFVTPLASTLSGLDRHHLLIVNASEIVLYSANLSNYRPVYFLKKSSQPEIQEQTRAWMLSLMGEQSFPLVVGGAPFALKSSWAQELLSQLPMKPLATIESSDTNKIADSARDIVSQNLLLRFRGRLQSWLKVNKNLTTDFYQIWHLLSLNQLSELYITDETQSLDFVDRRTAVDALVYDDLVEEALKKNVKVYRYPHLKQETGNSLLATAKIS